LQRKTYAFAKSKRSYHFLTELFKENRTKLHRQLAACFRLYDCSFGSFIT